MSSKSSSSKKGVVTSPKAVANEMVLTRQKSAQFKRQLRNKDRSMKRITQLLKSPKTSKMNHANIKNSKVAKKIPPKSVTKPIEELITSDKMMPIVKIDKVVFNVEPETISVYESKANIKPSKMDVAEEKNEYYPNKTKRKVKVKKIMLKPHREMKVIGDTKGVNKRKMGIPKKDLLLPCRRQTTISTTSPKHLSNDSKIVVKAEKCYSLPYSDMNTNEVLQIMEKDLTDEDLIEIFTCPSPVWWEDPPDSEYEEEAIEIKKEAIYQVSEFRTNTQFLPNQSSENKSSESHTEKLEAVAVNQTVKENKIKKDHKNGADINDNRVFNVSTNTNVEYKSQKHLNNETGVIVNPVYDVNIRKGNMKYRTLKYLDHDVGVIHNTVTDVSAKKESIEYKNQKHLNNKASVIDNSVCNIIIRKENMEYESRNHLNEDDATKNPVSKTSTRKEIKYESQKHMNDKAYVIDNRVNASIRKYNSYYKNQKRLNNEAGVIDNLAYNTSTMKEKIEYKRQQCLNNEAGTMDNTVCNGSTRKETIECKSQQHLGDKSVVNKPVNNISAKKENIEFQTQKHLDNKASAVHSPVSNVIKRNEIMKYESNQILNNENVVTDNTLSNVTREEKIENKSQKRLYNEVGVIDNNVCNISKGNMLKTQTKLDLETICRTKDSIENSNVSNHKLINNIAKSSEVQKSKNIEFLRKRNTLENILGGVKNRLLLGKSDVTDTYIKPNVVQDALCKYTVSETSNHSINHDIINKKSDQLLICPKKIVFCNKFGSNLKEMSKHLNPEPLKTQTSHSKTSIIVNEEIQDDADQSQNLENRACIHNTKADDFTRIDDNSKSRNKILEPSDLKHCNAALKPNLNETMKDSTIHDLSINSFKGLLNNKSHSLNSNISQNNAVSKIEAVTKNIWAKRKILENDSGCDRNKITTEINKMCLPDNVIGHNVILSNIKKTQTETNSRSPKLKKALLNNIEDLSNKNNEIENSSANLLGNINQLSNQKVKSDKKNNMTTVTYNPNLVIKVGTSNQSDNVSNFKTCFAEQSPTKLSRQNSYSESTDEEGFAYDDEMLMQLENINIPVENTEYIDVQKKENNFRSITVEDNDTTPHNQCNYLSNIFSISNNDCASNDEEIQEKKKFKIRLIQNYKEKPLIKIKHNYEDKFVSLIKDTSERDLNILSKLQKPTTKIIDKVRVVSPEASITNVDSLSLSSKHSLLETICNKKNRFVLDEKVDKDKAKSPYLQHKIENKPIEEMKSERSIHQKMDETDIKEGNLKVTDNEDLIMIQERKDPSDDLEFITVYEIIANTDKTEEFDENKLQFIQPKVTEIEKMPDRQKITVVSYKEELNKKKDNEKMDALPKVYSYITAKKLKNVNKKMKNKSDSVIRKIKASGKVQRNLDASQSIFSKSIVKNSLLANDEKSIISKQKKIKRQRTYRELKKRDRIVVSQDTRVKYCMKCSSIFDTEFCTYCCRKIELNKINKLNDLNQVK